MAYRNCEMYGNRCPDSVVAPPGGYEDTLGMTFGRNGASRVETACTVLTIVAAVSAAAQQAALVTKYPAEPTGSVVGYVQYNATKLPARFAEIRLVPKPPDDTDRVTVENQTTTTEKSDPRLRMASGVSVMDGSFCIDGVPAGDYLAGAVMPGYLISGTQTTADTATVDQLKRLLTSLPMVHVAAGQAASVTLMLHRGAVIGGRVQFADGSPAISAKVNWELAERDLAIGSVRMARTSPQREIVRQFEYQPRNGHGVEPMMKDATASLAWRRANML